MQDIFLSYSNKDRDRLKPLVAALEAEGWTVFWDHRAIKVAQDWHDVIGTAIQSCPCVIVAWSEQSVQSKWVREEALIARDRGVLYPIMIDPVSMPFGFTLIQAADFTNWDSRRDHQEFVELRDQLSMRLNLRGDPPAKTETVSASEEPSEANITRPVEVERPVVQSIMGDRRGAVSGVIADSPVNTGSRLKLVSMLALSAALAGAGYWYTQKFPDDGSTEGQQQETAQVEQTIVKDEPVVAVEAPAPEPKTYALTVNTEPSEALVRVNDEPLQVGQRFIEGDYTVSVTAEGYKPYQERVALSGTDRGLSVELDRFPLSFEPKMVEIPGGTFQMGCDPKRDDVEGGCLDSEKPLHKVTVPSFWMSATEVTVGQFRAFVKASKYKTDAEQKGSCYGDKTGKDDWGYIEGNFWDKPGFEQTDKHPVTCISWNDAKKYMDWLSEQTGDTYRLPTEAEWEYAARAGTNTAFSWGQQAKDGCDFANMADQEVKKVYGTWTTANCNDGFLYSAPVGSFSTNPFGLKDMHGNVWEWVEDCWVGDYNDAPDNGSARTACDADASRVLRGGSWSYRPRHLRSALRGGSLPSDRVVNVGFRAARTN